MIKRLTIFILKLINQTRLGSSICSFVSSTSARPASIKPFLKAQFYFAFVIGTLLFGNSAKAQDPNIFYYVSDGDNRLYSINRNTGANVNIGATATNIEALAYFPIPGQQTLYAANGGELGTINTSTGTFTTIGDMDGGGTLSGFVSGVATTQTLDDVDGLMFDGQSLVLWGVERNGGADILFQINRTTGEFIPDAFGAGVDYVEITGPGIAVDVDDLAVDPRTGEIYGVSNNGGINDVLFRVNNATGVFTVVSTLTENDIEGLSFSNDGRLYGSDGTDETLGEINIATGVFTVVQDLDGDDVESLAALVADANLISGNVFDDVNKDGIKDGGDGGIAGVTLYLFVDQNSDGRIDPEDTRVQSTVTDGSGNYQFPYVTTGTLLISTEPDTWGAGGTTRAITTDNIEAAVFTDAVNFGETDINNDFGLGSFTPSEDCDGDGLPDFLEGTIDSDGDGIQDQCDLDSDNDGIRDDVEGAGDFDDDGIPNYLDLDSDDDGIPDAIEADKGIIPAGFNATTGRLTGAVGTNGIVDAIETVADNGVITAPANSDADNNPDYLDLDSDNDGILDIIEAGGTVDADGDGQVDNPTDANNNGYADALETTPLTYPNTDSAEETSNGLPLLPNYIDIDSDGDGIDDTREGQSTSGYGFPTIINDVDEDGIIDFWDVSSGLNPIIPFDNDSDGTPDYIDLNSDNDPESDFIEGNDANFDGTADTAKSGVDANGNGLDDAFDAACVITGASSTFNTEERSEQNVIGGAIDLGSSDIEFLADGGDEQIIGIRFTNVAIAQGADVANAYLQFVAKDNTSGALTVTIEGQLALNAPAFTTGNSNVSNRSTRTSASETWSPPAWTDGNQGLDQRTVNIASIIEEIVGQASWVSGNSIVLIFSGASGQSRRRAESRDGVPADIDLVINLAGGPAQVCSSNVSLPDEDIDGEYDFRETDGALDSDFDGVPDSIDIDDDNDGITDIDEGYLGEPCPSTTITGVTTDLGINTGNTATLIDGITGAQNFFWNNSQAFTVARDIFNITFTEAIDLDEIRIVLEFDVGNNSFIDTGVEYAWQGSNDGSSWTTILTETQAQRALVGAELAAESEIFDLSSSSTAYTQYRLRWLSGGQVVWDPYIDEITITSSCTPVSNRDSDGDGIFDYLDLDSDNDGILDITEAGGGAFDANNDGRVDNYMEGDAPPNGLASVFETGGVPVDISNLPNLDTDNDGFKDFVDLDSDNDGIEDIIEAGGIDLNNDGKVDNATDGDGDGIANTFDINNGGGPLSDGDFDGDGFPNRVDIDSDGDGIVDVIESQASTGSPILPTATDTDNDGISNAFDVTGGTPTTPVDTDGDGQPDYLDINSDNDGLVDAVEGWDTDGSATPNTTPAGTDADGDGLDDNYDTVNGRNSTTNVYDTPGGDNSSDDYPDETTPDTTERDWREANVIDTDQDGIPDSIDIDDDNDGITDIDEGCIDTVIPAANASAASEITDRVDNPGNGINGNNGNFARFRDDNALMEVVLRADNVVKVGTEISIRARRTGGNTANRMIVTQSSDGVNFTNTVIFTFASTNVYDVKAYTLNSDATRIRILFDRSNGDLNVSNVSYEEFTIVCTGSDQDGDGIPNHLDLDADNDGIFDILEAGGGAFDANRDGRVDNYIEGNGPDGLASVFEPGRVGNSSNLPNLNSDTDGLRNFLDLDSDGDGITDLVESQVTSGSPVRPIGVDSDQDGIDNAFDINCAPCGAVTGVPTVPVNTDAGFVNSDLIPDYLDTDSDNDGLGDIIEGWDTNGNYIANTTPTGGDADNDGLDDGFDNVVGFKPTTNVSNGQTANSRPNITTATATTERDWREINNVTCAPGEVDGNIRLWLKANEGGNNWRDQSNNFASLTRTGTVTAGSMNFNPTNVFNGSAYYTANLSINSDANPDLAVIAVYKPSLADAGAVWGENNGSFDRYMQDASGQNNAVSNGTGTENDITDLFANGVTTLSSVIFDEDAGSGSRVFVNGELETSFTANHGSETSNNLQIGAIGTGLDQFTGEIAEIIVYNQLLSTGNDRQKIESYLALKYGITLSSDTDGDATAFEAGEGDYLLSNGTAMWDASEESNGFQNNIAGIARDDASCLIQLQSKSENSDAIVTIGLDDDSDGLETSNALNESVFGTDLSALVWGHDGSSLYDPNNIEFDKSQVRTRLNREWRAQEAGTVGTVIVRFDVSDLLGPTGVGTNDETKIVLLVDADGDFSAGATVVSQSFEVDADGFVSFQVNLADGNFFTLGSGELGALPITLLSFNAESKEDHVVLNWITSSEENNSHFRIERSTNGSDFETVGFMDGAGTTNQTNNYEFKDYSPINGMSFYRLIDIDFAGEENPSELLSIKYSKLLAEVKVYPNPAAIGESFKINIEPDVEVGPVQMYQLNGVTVNSTTRRSGDQLTIQPKGVKGGVYLLSVVLDGQSFKFKVIIR